MNTTLMLDPLRYFRAKIVGMTLRPENRAETGLLVSLATMEFQQAALTGPTVSKE